LGKCKGYAVCREKKRQGQQQVKGKKFQPLPVVPEYLIRIKEQVLATKIAGYNCYAEEEYVGDESQGETAQKLLPEKHQKGTAGTIPQQGKAYDHIGEMVVLDNGKKAHQKNLVGERHC
jgi:hypothetical protein